MNQGRALKLRTIKSELTSFVEGSVNNPSTLCGLGLVMLEKEWSPEDLEADIATSAIEALLDEIENGDYEKLSETYEILKSQELVK
jgi:hypothetical protein